MNQRTEYYQSQKQKRSPRPRPRPRPRLRPRPRPSPSQRKARCRNKCIDRDSVLEYKKRDWEENESLKLHADLNP